MTAPEREHIIAAYTFELSKCYEQAVKERAPAVLANIDTDLCAQVAAGLGLPAPAPSMPRPAVEPSPALSQIGGTWPLDGRVVGVLAGPDSDVKDVAAARQAVLDAGMLPLVISPTGGVLRKGRTTVTVQRTFATARSTEFDALIVAGAPGPAADTTGDRDAKASRGKGSRAETSASRPAGSDPRVLILVAEMYRHSKAIGGFAERGPS